MLLPLIARCTWPGATHAGAGGARSRAISDRISANICREDHGFVRPGGRLTFYAVAEAFLAKCLYGKGQRVRADFTSLLTIKIANRWRLVPGLSG